MKKLTRPLVLAMIGLDLVILCMVTIIDARIETWLFNALLLIILKTATLFIIKTTYKMKKTSSMAMFIIIIGSKSESICELNFY